MATDQYQDPYADPYKQVDTSDVQKAPDYSGQTTTQPTQPKTSDPYAVWQQYNQQNPQGNIQGLIDYFNQNGVTATRATHANGTLPSDDKAIVNGQMIDFYGDVGGANTPQYNVEQPGGGGGGSTSGGFSASSSYTIPSFNVMDPRVNDLYSTLLARSGQGLNVSVKDPAIAAQTDAYRAEQTRGVRDYLAQQAESQGPNANLGAESRLANEHAAQATGGLQATLMGNELQAKRQEIQSALQMEAGILSDQQKLQLSQQLGQIDAALRLQGLNSSNDQFVAQLGFNQADRSSYWDAIRSGLL